VGLDLDLRAMGIEEPEITRSWAPEDDEVDFQKILADVDYAPMPSAMATIYSNIDPSCCPAGKSVVATMVPARAEPFEATLGTGGHRGRAYKELKTRLTAQLLEKMSRALQIPDLERHVEILSLATPITIRRFTENRGGAYVGWRYSADQVRKNIPQQSPVANLFLCGHWVEPGGGVNNVMTGGLNAAELADAYLGR
jgi:prolycopene isomerase